MTVARRRLTGLIVVVLLVALALTMAGVFPFRQIIAADRQLELTRDKLATLEAENARLDEVAARLQTDAEVERLAREQFGFVREGEVGYVVEWVDVEPAPEPALPPADERRWWERAWDFMSGRDRAGG